MSDRAKEIFKRIGVLLALLILISYTAYHIFSLFGDDISTVVVASTVEQKVVAMDGYIFRNEKLLRSEYGGAVDYIASDGQKVSIGQALACVYEKGNNVNVADSLEQLDRQIAIIEAGIGKGQTLSDLPQVRKDIESACSEISKKLAGGEIRNISDNIDSLKVLLAMESALTNDNSPLEDTLASLVAAKEHLRAAGGKSAQETSAESGYFYSKVDGYESLFTTAAADALTPATYLDMIRRSPDELSGQKVYGKLASGSEWRFVCTVSAQNSQHFEEGGTYDVIFCENDDAQFPLTLLKKLSDESTSSQLLIFECNRAPADFDFARHQSVEAVVQSVKGISVPKDVPHKRGGNYYVYILQGSVVRERCVRISFEGSDYYIVEDGVEKDENGVYLQSNDILVLSGKNLFDGRILE